jgi:ATPases involved in chromosome partitioning
MANVKTIATWGLTGKTTMAVNLATTLATMNSKALICLLSTQNTYGDIQGFFGQTIQPNHSLLGAFEDGTDLTNCLWKASEQENNPLSRIFLLSLPNQVELFDIPRPSFAEAEMLLDKLRGLGLFDYIVVDGTSDIREPLSTAALAQAQQVLCLHRPGIASLHWYISIKNILGQLDEGNRVMHIEYAHDDSCSADKYFGSLNLQAGAVVPLVRNARQYENEGIPIVQNTSREAIAFSRAMQGLVASL